MIQDRGIERWAAVADDQAVVATQPLAQRSGDLGVCVGVVNAAAFACKPVPVGEGFEACEIGCGEVLLAHVLVAGDEYLGA